MIWGEDDTFGRWVQGICGVVLLGVAIIAALYEYQSATSGHWNTGKYGYWVDTVAIGSLVLAVRCLWYAITGKDNINRDNFN